MDERRGRTDGQRAAIGLALHAPVIEQNIAMRRSKSSNNGETGIITLGAHFMRVVLEWDGTGSHPRISTCNISGVMASGVGACLGDI